MAAPVHPSIRQKLRPLFWLVVFLLAYTLLLGHLHWVENFPWLAWGPSRGEQGPAPYVSLCLFKNLVHLPCVLCGLTRSFVLIEQGRWLESLQYHPLGLPTFALCLTFVGLMLAAPARAEALTRCLTTRPALAALGIVLLLCWAFKLSQGPAFW